jgi:hypothetical protein
MVNMRKLRKLGTQMGTMESTWKACGKHVEGIKKSEIV